MLRSARCSMMLVACVTLSCPDLVRAQPTTPATTTRFEPEPFAPFVRPTQFWLAWPKGAYFEADPTIPLFLASRTSELRSITDVTKPQSGRTGVTLVLLPHLTFRQLTSSAARSAPVLTPTFNPGFEFSVFRLSTAPRGRRPWFFPSIDPTSRAGEMLSAQFRIAHYSNGQSGCLYDNQTYQASSDSCVPEGRPGNALNTKDGSFSTDYVETTLQKSWILFDSSYAERVLQTLGVTGRVNPGFLAPVGGMDPELASAYGRYSISGRYEFKARYDETFGLWRRVPRRLVATTILSVDHERAIGRASAYAQSRTTLEAVLAFPRLYGIGLATRYTTGFDYYNIAFGDRISRRFSVGLVFDHSRAMALTPAARRKVARTFQ